MGVPFVEVLNDDKEIYVCAKCRICLSSATLLTSKNFHGNTGPAFLFSKAVNVYLGEACQRGMTTGQHIVRDVFCQYCDEKVGWYYDIAVKKDQMYKEGQFILEENLIRTIPGFTDGVERRRSFYSTHSRSNSSSTGGFSTSGLSYDDDKEDITVMGRLILENPESSKYFECRQCKLFLTRHEEMVSPHFRGSTGPAFLFANVTNIRHGELQQRNMMTGKHFVRDVHCKFCDAKLGWMYEFAVDNDQQYKEGKVILERSLISETMSTSDSPLPTPSGPYTTHVMSTVSIA